MTVPDYGLPLVPREDRLLVYWYKEIVRDYISNPAYLRLPLEGKGVLQVLRHQLLHQGMLPTDARGLSWLTREDEAAFERWVPQIIAVGLLAVTPDGRFLWSPELESQVGPAADEVKRHQRDSKKGGENSGRSRRAKKEASLMPPQVGLESSGPAPVSDIPF